LDLQESITSPRWLLGKTWGDEVTNLKIESRFDEKLIADLRNAGHEIELISPFNDLMGHAGALVRHPNGVIEGATDPRADGILAGL
jgi:gamma-glutamyltranspeptidase/glutathione hydrolase